MSTALSLRGSLITIRSTPSAAQSIFSFSYVSHGIASLQAVPADVFARASIA